MRSFKRCNHRDIQKLLLATTIINAAQELFEKEYPKALGIFCC